jgi:hypothetical protein
MNLTAAGITTLLKLEHLANAPDPMFVIPVPRTSLVSAVQLPKRLGATEVTPSPSTAFVKRQQSRNALAPIVGRATKFFV